MGTLIILTKVCISLLVGVACGNTVKLLGDFDLKKSYQLMPMFALFCLLICFYQAEQQAMIGTYLKQVMSFAWYDAAITCMTTIGWALLDLFGSNNK